MVLRDAPLHLLESRAFLGSDTSVDVASIQPLLIDAEMRNFVASDIATIRSKRWRIQALVNKLADNGYYTNYYDAGLTQSARDTFRKKRGNCLSFTHMFIALAREAGLQAHYELVHAPPMYTVNDGVLEHQVHIRVRITLPRRMNAKRSVSVDFNRRNISEFDGRIVSDEFAKSLHFANNAIEAWRNNDESTTFPYIVEAIRLAPRHPDHWVNLATFYSRRGMAQEAFLINRHALFLDPYHTIALGGILEHSNGKEFERAKAVIERHRRNNPYYQFAMAQRAVSNDDLLSALRFVDRSLELNKRDHRFFGLRGEILTSLKSFSKARESFRRARSLAEYEVHRQQYQQAVDQVEQLMLDLALDKQALHESSTEMTAQFDR